MGELRHWLQSIDDYEFEKFVAELWRKMGWETTVTDGSTDRGIDVIARKTEPFDTKQLIQAKRYSDGSTVGSPQIQQYASLRHQEPNVDTVVVVTTSTFSKQAAQMATDLNVKLIDGTALEAIIRQYECEELVLRYADPSATTEIRTEASPIEGSTQEVIPTKPSSTDDGQINEDKPKYGRRSVHAILGLLTVWWTFGLGNAVYATWSYHKAKYADGVPPAYESNVSDNWYYGVVSAVLVGGFLYLIGLPLSDLIPGLSPLMGVLLLFSWVLLPVALYYDIQHVRTESDWNPVTGLWVIGTILFVFNVIVGVIYLVRRRSQMGHDRFTEFVRVKLADEDDTQQQPSGPAEALKTRYVDGELDEHEFDRELEQLLEADDRESQEQVDEWSSSNKE